jgi:hypothetical protein
MAKPQKKRLTSAGDRGSRRGAYKAWDRKAQPTSHAYRHKMVNPAVEMRRELQGGDLGSIAAQRADGWPDSSRRRSQRGCSEGNRGELERRTSP